MNVKGVVFMNTFYLYVDKDIQALAGYRLGEEMYRDQIEDRVDFTEDIEITIPSQILKISSSWVQGFFNGFIDALGYEVFSEHVHVHCDNPDVVKTIYRNLI